MHYGQISIFMRSITDRSRKRKPITDADGSLEDERTPNLDEQRGCQVVLLTQFEPGTINFRLAT